jgi:hypothetical protein
MILGGDIYQMHTKKRDLYLKKENRGIIPRGAMVTGGNMFDVFLALHQSDIPFSKGERLFRITSKEFR